MMKSTPQEIIALHMWYLHHEEIYGNREVKLALEPKNDNEVAVTIFNRYQMRDLIKRLNLLQTSFVSYVKAFEQTHPTIQGVHVESRLLEELQELVYNHVDVMDYYYQYMGRGVIKPNYRIYYLLCSPEELEDKFTQLEKLLFDNALDDNPLDLYVSDRERYKLPSNTQVDKDIVQQINEEIERSRKQ